MLVRTQPEITKATSPFSISKKYNQNICLSESRTTSKEKTKYLLKWNKSTRLVKYRKIIEIHYL